jgi:hypothetical protein
VDDVDRLESVDAVEPGCRLDDGKGGLARGQDGDLDALLPRRRGTAGDEHAGCRAQENPTFDQSADGVTGESELGGLGAADDAVERGCELAHGAEIGAGRHGGAKE